MGGAGVNAGRAVLHNGGGGVAEAAAGVHHVVHQKGVFVLDVADQVHDLADVGTLAAFIDNGHRDSQFFSKFPGAGNRAEVRGNDDDIFRAQLLGKLQEIGGKNRHTHQMVDRYVKKSLNLGGVQIHGQNAVSAGGGNQVGAELGGDRVAGLGFAVLAGIAEIGDNRGNAAGRGPLESVHHNQQFHQVVVNRTAGRLHYKDVRAAHRFLNGNRNLAVGKMGNRTFSKRKPQLFCNLPGNLGIGVRRKNFDVLAVNVHRFLYPP